MINVISRTSSDCRYIGSSFPPLDKAAGSETNYLSGTQAGIFTVEEGKKASVKCLVLCINPFATDGVNSRCAEIAGIINCGVSKIFLDSTQLTETRIQDSTFPNNSAADEMVVPMYNAFQAPSFGDSFVVPANTVITVKVTPAQTTRLVWQVSLFGKNASGKVIQKSVLVTALTTANQIAFTYTPDADLTLYSITVDCEAIGQFLGQARIDMDGRQILETPYLGCGETSSNMFDDKGFAGEGCGSLIIPLWDFPMYPKQNIGFTPIHWAGDSSLWQLITFYSEENLSSGASSYAF